MILIDSVSKNFGNIKALEQVNLKIEKGSMTYLVGPNASGKSTLIKIILGLVKPSAGNVVVNGIKLNGHSEYRNSIGYMPQTANFPDNLSIKEIFDMIAEIRSVKNFADSELIESYNLYREFNKKLKHLSGGTKQKVNAAIAFAFNPEILILDEPTAGLDPYASSILKNKILKENKLGKTIIFTSHILKDLQELAREIVLLVNGKIVLSGIINDIISNNGIDLEEKIISIMKENLYADNQSGQISV
ncbi:ABC transporter ATP-binding protein [Melioribacter sp. OK-6-Me]|uniref:ABC transporter ATP-binding protein n=1 Tax=unclassified Melioribacter TaxID=2627329 RepID=UPI003EDACDA1